MLTVTGRLVFGTAAAATSKVLRFTPTYIDPTIGTVTEKEYVSATTDGSGNFSITLNKGSYAISIGSNAPFLNVEVPEGTGSVLLTSLKLS